MPDDPKVALHIKVPASVLAAAKAAAAAQDTSLAKYVKHAVQAALAKKP